VHVVPDLKISEGRWLNDTRKKGSISAIVAAPAAALAAR
jgi:hypothetical protein